MAGMTALLRISLLAGAMLVATAVAGKAPKAEAAEVPPGDGATAGAKRSARGS